MNTFAKIKSIADNLGLPAWPDVYTGKDADRPERWMTYNLADDRGNLYGDDAPQTAVHSVQVHLFMPASKNFFAINNTIRDALFSAGFSYPAVTVLVDDTTTASSGTQKIRHLIFECEIEDEEFQQVEAI